MYCYCSQTLIRLLRRHLPRRGRQSAAAGTGGQYPQGVCRIRKAPSSLTAAQSRPPLQGAAENRGLYCTRKMVPDRHHQDSVRRVAGLREVTRGGQIRPGK